MNKTLSIVVPTFNQGNFIEDCLSSIVSQTHGDLQIIIQDSFSQDATESICQRFMAADKRIQYFREKDLGQSDAINRGLKRSTGTYFTWLCSDDRYHNKHAIQNLIQGLGKVSSAEYVGAYGNAFQISEQGELLPEIYYSKKKDLIAEDFKLIWPLCQPASILLTEAVHRVGGVDAQLYLGMDLDLFFKLLKNGKKILYLDTDVADNRIQENSKTFKFKHATVLNCLKLIHSHLGNVGTLAESTYLDALSDSANELYTELRDAKAPLETLILERIFKMKELLEKSPGIYAELKKKTISENLAIQASHDLNGFGAHLDLHINHEFMLGMFQQLLFLNKLFGYGSFAEQAEKLNPQTVHSYIWTGSGLEINRAAYFDLGSVDTTQENFSIDFTFPSPFEAADFLWEPMHHVYCDVRIADVEFTYEAGTVEKISPKKLMHNGLNLKSGWVKFLRLNPTYRFRAAKGPLRRVKITGNWKRYAHWQLGNDTELYVKRGNVILIARSLFRKLFG